MRPIKSRVPTRCKNGHFRWMYCSMVGGEVETTWGTKTCDCPTLGVEDGFSPCGEDELFTELHDMYGKPMYVGDILQYRSPEKKKMKGFIVFEDGNFRVIRVGLGKTGNMNTDRMTAPSYSKRHAVVGNVHEDMDLLLNIKKQNGMEL